MTIQSRLAAAGIAAAISFVAVAARAEPVSTTISYADLNLDSAAGRHQFAERVVASIRRMCGTADGLTLSQASDIRRCRRAAHTDAALRIAEASNRTLRLAATRADIVLASR